MSRTLFLLVTSDRPDTYLNSAVHCILCEHVRAVEFLHVHGFGESIHGAQRDQSSATTLRYVTTLLQDLSTVGEYRFFVGKDAGRRVDLRQVYSPDQFASLQETYRQCLSHREVRWSHRDIPYSNLRQEIAAIAKRKPPAIVDVSSVKKIFIGDLVAAGVIEGLDSLYTFDLLQRPDHDRPWTMLFHDLQPADDSGAKYHYTNLLDTQVFRECARSLLIKKPSLLLSLTFSVVLLVATLIAYVVVGPSSLLVQAAFSLSSVASILSLFYTFFPLRRP